MCQQLTENVDMQVSLPDVALAEGVKQLEAGGGEGKAGKVYGAKQLVYRLGSATQVCRLPVCAYGVPICSLLLNNRLHLPVCLYMLSAFRFCSPVLLMYES
jgi:hypothetical protein